jgi:hypothetical protein
MATLTILIFLYYPDPDTSLQYCLAYGYEQISPWSYGQTYNSFFFIPEAQTRACTVLGTGMDDQCKPDKKQPEQVMSCIFGAPCQQMTFPAKSCLV